MSDNPTLRKEQLAKIAMFNQLGHIALTAVLKEAAYQFTHPTSGGVHISNFKKEHYRESREAFFYIVSPSLDYLVQSYCLSYNPDQLRACFFNKLKLREYL